MEAPKTLKELLAKGSGRNRADVVAIAMEVLYRIAQAEPDLKQELADSISWRMDEETAGFRNRGLKILKKLSR